MPPNEQNPLSTELKTILSVLGRGLGTVSVYGLDHPSVDQIIEQTFSELQNALKTTPSIAIGSFNGTLTVNGEPASAHDMPTKTIEKRLVSLKISHLVLNSGLSKKELKHLLGALCSPSDEKMKQTISSGVLKHVELDNVKYVVMHKGEKKVGAGGDHDQGITSIDKPEPPVQVGQIMAFLKGEPSASGAEKKVKDLLSDPEKLGQMIMDAAAVRQSTRSLAGGENMADIVIGCLRRTYDGMKREADFQDAKGKASLTKAMMLLEKTVLDKIRNALGPMSQSVDRRILSAIKEMEEEQHMDVLAAHYFEQRRKIEKVEERMIDYIQEHGEAKAREQFTSANLPPKDWHRLMVEAGVSEKKSGGGISMGSGMDLSALAIVLEKIEDLSHTDPNDPQQINTTIQSATNGLSTYADRIETRISELEGQIELEEKKNSLVDSNARHLTREELMEEISNLTLALIQPLTVINASAEAALDHAGQEKQKEFLDLVYTSGRRMEKLSKRLMKLVGYPLLEKPM